MVVFWYQLSIRSNPKMRYNLVFDRFVDTYGSKNGHQEDTSHSKEIALRAQDLLTILGSVGDIIGEINYDHSMRNKRITMTMNMIFI